MASDESLENSGKSSFSGDTMDAKAADEPVPSTSSSGPSEPVNVKSEEGEGEGDGSGRDSPFSMSLDVLAQVASDRLQKEPRKGQLSSLVPKKLTKRSVQCLDLLNLEQICIVSDKILINMFAEMNSDEIKRNYTYTCQLMPQTCQMQFSSFGNESRAKSLVKAHLYQHIASLKKQAKGNPDFEFHAEPIHARKKRLAAEKVAEKKKRKNALKALSKKSPNQNLFTSIRADRSTMYDPRRRKSSTSSNSAGQSQSQASKKGRKLAPNTVSSRQLAKMKVVEVVYTEEQEIKTETDGTFGLEETTTMSDIDVVDTPPQDEDIAAEEVVTANQSVTEERMVWARMCQTEPFHDHCYTTVFGSMHRYSEDRGFGEPCLLDDSSSRTAGVKKTLDSLAMDSEGRQVIMKVNTGDGMVNDIYVPVINLPGAEDSVVEEKSAAAKQLTMGPAGDGEPYPPMPKSDLAFRGRMSVPDEFEASSDDDNNSSKKKRTPKEGSAEWERKMALQCIRQLRCRKKEEDSLVCKICRDKTFTATATLLYHYRSHAGIKPFVCLICNTTFTRQHSLNYHMLIHNNQSRFTCKDCGRKFRHPSHFKEHLRRHTGETPFHCMDCPLRFKTRNTYKRHLRTRHGKLLTANGIRLMPKEQFLKICSRPYRRTDEDSDYEEEEMEEEEVEDVGGTTIPAATGTELAEVEEAEDPAEFPQGCIDEAGSPAGVQDDMSASNKLLELCSQVVKQEAG